MTDSSHDQVLGESEVIVFHWPACSPDFSPIEHIRDMVRIRLGQFSGSIMDSRHQKKEVQVLEIRY